MTSERAPILKPPSSIGTTLLAITGALTAMVALLALERIAHGVNRYKDVARLEEISVATSSLLEVSENLAFERDLTIAALEETDREEVRELARVLAEARQRTAAASAAAFRAISPFPKLGPWSVHMNARLQAIESLRAEADHAIAAPSATPVNLRDDWIAGAALYIQEADGLWLELVQPYSGVDATITQQFRYMQVLSVVYDYSGRERSLVTQVLASAEDASPYQLAQMNHAQGVLDASWRAAHDLAVQGGFYEEVKGEFLDAKSHYDTLRGMLREAFYAPDASGGGLPISAGLWLALSEQYSDSLDSLRDVSRAAIGDRLQSLRRDAFVSVALQVGILVAAMLLCGLCGFVISRVVVEPINAIVKALIAASSGERVDFVNRLPTRRDEIGKLSDVLHVFQRQVETVRATANELDASERRLRAIIDNAVDGLITTDERGAIEAFNPASERLFGYPASEIVGRHVSTILPALFHGGQVDAVQESEERAFDLTAASAIETTGVRKDGSRFPIELTLSEIQLADTSLLSALVRDISPRKAAEAALMSHTRALEHSNKELDDFAYIASHDLKEPLRGLHNHARFLLEDNDGKLDDDSVRRLNRLVALTQRMERLVNDLLYFSRLGRQELAVHATDLSVVVRDIEGTLDNFLEEHGARIVIPEPLPTITCDAPRVSELFRNLITNAVKYNDKPEKVVEVGALAEKRAPNGATRGPVFYVRDNGLGIPPEFHQEVFRIFKRLNNHRTASEGTGVGLTFVKKIVERHGGEIWIESASGQGACFFFTLEPGHEDRTLLAA